YTGIRVRVLLLKASRDVIHVGTRLFEVNAWFQERDGLQGVPSAVGRFPCVEGDGDPQVHFAAGKLEVWRHNANDRVAFAVQGEGVFHYARVGAEPTLPQAMADDDHAIAAGLIFFG